MKVILQERTLNDFTMKRYFVFIAMFLGVLILTAQETQKKSKKELKAEKKAKQVADTKALVESKNFVFKARTANPMKGSSKTLTTEYDVTLKNDSVYCYLPYYGVAYSADYGSSEGPLTFNQPVITFTIESAKKGGYIIEVKTSNKNDALSFTFHISETGSTSLSVNSTKRQSITYFGDIVKIEEKK